MSLRISDYCTKNAILLRPTDRIYDVVRAFLKQRFDIVCIVDDSKQLIGIVSKYDIYRSLLKEGNLDTPLEPLIRKDVVLLNSSDTVDEVRNVFLKNNVSHGVVLNGKKQIYGVVEKSNIIRAFLHEKEHLNRQITNLIEHLPEAVISIDINGFISTFNNYAENMFYLKAKDVVGKPINEIFPEITDDLLSTIQNFESIEPHKISLKDKNVIASFIPISNKVKKIVTGTMIILQDITTLESIAKELETTKNLKHTFHQALALSADAVLILDSEGFITQENKAFRELLNLNNEESIINKHWTKVLPELSIKTEQENKAENRNIQMINGKLCVVIQEPIIRAGKLLGHIIKIIYNQLEEWKNLLHQINKLENELNFYKKNSNRIIVQPSAFDNIISFNHKIIDLKQQAMLAAKSPSTILINGESGTGKELFAEAIHKESGRKGNLIKVNCAAIPKDLIESEFFGYEEGAFTGARKGGKKGKFELADNGTLFLDEIGDMPIDLQVKLLRVLQEQTFERVGGNTTKKVNVRIIAATNKDLKQEVKKGKFREDLYYRIDVVRLVIPPLRERLDDLPILCENLINKINKKLNKNVIGITNETLSIFQNYSWPGNVRELENVIERAINLGVDKWIEPHHLPNSIKFYNDKKRPQIPMDSSNAESTHLSLEDFEKKLILEKLNQANGNRSKAAQLLGISRSTLYNKLKKYKIEKQTNFYFS